MRYPRSCTTKLQDKGERELLVVRTRENVLKMNRSRYEIMAWIMQNCLLPRSKTHIIHKGNMSFAQINAYLSLLTSLELLSQENGKYETTDKGRQFVSAYKDLGKIMGLPAPSITGMSVLSGSAVSTSFEL